MTPPKEALTGELVTTSTDNVSRMSPFTMDDIYIEHYLNNPDNKAEALRQAAAEMGIECDTSRQAAHVMHNRLRHKIDRALSERISSGAALGYSILFKLAATAEAENVQAACAARLIEYAGKNKPTEAPDKQDRDDINKAIEQTKARIYALTGKQTA